MTHGVCQMKIKLKTELRNYFRGENTWQHFSSIEDTPIFSFATLFDPPYKKGGFSSASAADSAVEQLNITLAELFLIT